MKKLLEIMPTVGVGILGYNANKTLENRIDKTQEITLTFFVILIVDSVIKWLMILS